jgi:hypothetical protein
MIEIIGLIILLLVIWIVLPNTIDEWFQRRDNLRKKQLRQSTDLDQPLVTDRELKEELWKLEELIESGRRSFPISNALQAELRKKARRGTIDNWVSVPVYILACIILIKFGYLMGWYPQPPVK